MILFWDLSGGDLLALNGGADIIKVRYPSALLKIYNNVCSLSPRSPARAAFSRVVNASLFRGSEGIPLDQISWYKLALRHVPWWCVESRFPGDVCYVSAALMFHLISFLATERVLLSSSRQRLAQQLAYCLPKPCWATAGWEHLPWGGFLRGVCLCFFKLRSWKKTSLLLPSTSTPVSFTCVTGNEHAQRTGKSLSSDREEMIIALHL